MLVMLTMLRQLETAKKTCALRPGARGFFRRLAVLATQAMLRSRLTSYLSLIRLRLQGHHQLAGSLTFQGKVGGNMEGQQSRAIPPLQRAGRSAPEQLPYSSLNLTNRDFAAKLREKLRESRAPA